jgi:hypothetical protein
MHDMPALGGSFCASCGDPFYPRRLACPRCGGAMQRCDFSGKGDVYSYTVVKTATAEQMVIALVHLAEGAYVTARVIDVQPQAIFIGLPVEVVGTDGAPTFRQRRSLVE